MDGAEVEVEVGVDGRVNGVVVTKIGSVAGVMEVTVEPTSAKEAKPFVSRNGPSRGHDTRLGSSFAWWYPLIQGSHPFRIWIRRCGAATFLAGPAYQTGVHTAT